MATSCGGYGEGAEAVTVSLAAALCVFALRMAKATQAMQRDTQKRRRRKPPPTAPPMIAPILAAAATITRK